MKKSQKKQSRAPKKNVELTDQRSERWIDNSDFIGPSLYRDQYTRETWPYLIFWIYCWSFWSNLVIFSHDQAQSIMTYWWDVRFLRIVQSDKSRASGVYLKFCIWHEHPSFSIAAHVITRLLLDQIYPPLKTRVWFNIFFVFLVRFMSDSIEKISHR